MSSTFDPGAVNALIDHQADLQSQLDRVRRELAAWAAWGAAVSLLVALLAWKLRSA